MQKKPKKFKRKKAVIPNKKKLQTSNVNIRPPASKKQSPRNPRIIAEKVKKTPGVNITTQGVAIVANGKKHPMLSLPVWLYALSSIVLIGVLLLSVNFQKENERLQKVREQRQTVEKDLQHWQQIDTQYPGSKDIQVKLATIEYRLGDFEKAKLYVEKALQLDPNDQQAQKIQVILKKNNF